MTAVWTGTKADAFLGSQGDPWDTQEDMAMAIVGAITALTALSGYDKEMARDETWITKKPAHCRMGWCICFFAPLLISLYRIG